MIGKLLITGITGELGRALIAPLRERKIDALCIVRKDVGSYVIDRDGWEPLTADITDRESLFRHLSALKGKVGAILHMASARHGRPEDELKRAILDGTVNLYECAEAMGCRKMLYLSSTLAAGWVATGEPAIDETRVPQSRYLSFFGAMKYAAERELLRRSAEGSVKVTVVRPGNIYGPPTKLSFIKFVRDLLLERRRLFFQRAKGAVMWAPVYIDDAIEALFMILERGSFNNETYFLTGQEHPTLERIARLIAPEIGVPIGEMDLQAKERGRYLVHRAYDLARSRLFSRPPFPDFVFSSEKLRTDFGFVPRTSLDEGVRATIAFARSKGIL